MTRFEFASPPRILFGSGALREAAPAAATMGRKALLCTGRGTGRAAPLLEALAAAGVAASVFPAEGEPTVDTARRAVDLARAEGCDHVIGFGGGSALDTAKAAAALLANGGDPLDYLEVIGKGRPMSWPSYPWIAIPTTAGSGSEVSRNAVLCSPEHKVKASLRGPGMLARLAIVDPELTLGLPREITASTGLDALTQLIEPFVSSKANPMTDALCREGIACSARSLEKACRDGTDLAARVDLCLASLLGGLCLANAGLGAVHGIAGPLGGAFPVPHGAACARLLPEVVEANLAALTARAPVSPAFARYDEIARLLTGDGAARAPDAAGWLRERALRLGIPGLSAYGLKAPDIPKVASKARESSSMKANPVLLSQEEIEGILLNSL